MSTTILLVLLLAATAFIMARRRAVVTAGPKLSRLHSLPNYHGAYAAIAAALPALALWAVWGLFESSILGWIVTRSLPADVVAGPPEMIRFFIRDVITLSNGGSTASEPTPAMLEAAGYYGSLRSASRIALFVGSLGLAAAGAWIALGRVAVDFRARNKVERVVATLLWLAAAISIATTAGIVFSVLFESIRFFQRVPITEFLFGLNWSPQTALRADQVGSSGSFGAVPLIAGTFLITLIAILVAGPIGMFSAIYLSQYASHRFRATAKPILEILAGVPTVVYGFFAALTVAPFIRSTGEAVGLSVASESALAAGFVMGLMIIPFVSSLADDALTSVPTALRDASFGLGATRAETIRQVLIPAALPGIIAGFLLAISRAVGETMIVVMAAGLAANLTANPLASVTTITVQIVSLLTGDQEFDSAKTLAAFALGLLLFVMTLLLNVVALYVMQKYREKYD